MAKKLVNEKRVESFVIGGNFYMDGTVILTPGAKDLLRDKGVTIVYGPRPQTCVPKGCEPAKDEPGKCDKQKLEATVGALLKKEYGITDDAQIKAFTSLIADLIEMNA